MDDKCCAAVESESIGPGVREPMSDNAAVQEQEVETSKLPFKNVKSHKEPDAFESVLGEWAGLQRMSLGVMVGLNG